MKIHIQSGNLLVIEADFEELPDDESVRQAVEKCLGNAQWPSVEVECFEHKGRLLVTATPVKVYLPEFLVKLL